MLSSLGQKFQNYAYSGVQSIRWNSYQQFRPYDFNFTTPKSKKANKQQAAKNHSESEKKRRMRINSQFDILKQLFHNNQKKDKASLLDATIHAVKILKKDCSPKEQGPTSSKNKGKNEATSNQKVMKEDSIIPKKMEEARNTKNKEGKEVSNINDASFPSWENKWSLKHEESGLMKATLNCEDKQGLMSTIAKALGSVEAKVVKVEMVTVGGRTRVILWVKDIKEEKKGEEILKRTLSALIHRPNPTKKRRTSL